MKTRTVLLVAFLASCTNSPQPVGGPPLPSAVDTSPEVFKIQVPEGSTIGYSSTRPGLQIVEYVPTGQTVERWTDMLTMLIADRKSAKDIDEFFERMTRTFSLGCAVKPIVEAPSRFMDAGFPAGIQTAICGRSRQFGTANVVIYKMIQGDHGFYQLQRAWNSPAVARSQDVPFTPEMRASASERLGLAHICVRKAPDQAC